MYRRIVGLSLLVATVLLVVEIARRRSSVQHAPRASYTPDPAPPDDMIASEIEAALETPPIVRSADAAELAFVAAAVGIDITPDALPQLDEARAPIQEITAYCMRCRTKRTVQEPRIEQASDGRRMARGTCPVCGSKMARFLKEQ